MTAQLTYRYLGGAGNPPLVIAHGMFGSSRNWVTVGKQLADTFEVFALDLRNHGDSPHRQDMTYSQLVEDIVMWLDSQALTKVVFLGHSLGGKVGMLLACQQPEFLNGLVVLDIAPKAYPPYHTETLAALRALELSVLVNRQDADDQLKLTIKDRSLRQFLLTNLQRDSTTGLFSWKVNLTALAEYQLPLASNPLQDEDHYEGPCLFIQGGQSNFITPGDKQAILKHFPQATVAKIKSAGHNIHMDAPKDLAHWLKGYFTHCSS